MVDQYEAVLPRAKKQLLDDRKFLAGSVEQRDLHCGHMCRLPRLPLL